MEYHITQYDLEQGALEIQYMEEFFGEFPRKKTAAEIVRRLTGRAHLILLANAPLADDTGTVVPVSFKVAHEIQSPESEPKLNDQLLRMPSSRGTVSLTTSVQMPAASSPLKSLNAPAGFQTPV